MSEIPIIKSIETKALSHLLSLPPETRIKPQFFGF